MLAAPTVSAASMTHVETTNSARWCELKRAMIAIVVEICRANLRRH
jgi:hypothetical protein